MGEPILRPRAVVEVVEPEIEHRPKHWRITTLNGRKLKSPEADDLKGLEALSPVERIEAVAAYGLRLSGHLRSEQDLQADLVRLNDASQHRSQVGTKLERLEAEDAAREQILELLPQAAIIADNFQRGEFYSRRQEFLKATAAYDSLPAIGRVNRMFQRSLIGPHTYRGATDALRIIAAHLEEVPLPAHPAALHSVE